MASAFGHAATALALGRFRSIQNRTYKFWIFMILCSILPDADVVAFRFGIPYGDPLGHRGFTHSILFAVLTGFGFAFVFFSRPGRRIGFSSEQWATAFSLSASALSHGLLDACTNGGLGVGFFIPFNNDRFFFPFRPIQVSPISVSAFFEARGWSVLKSEFVWIGRVIFLILLSQFLVHKFRGVRR